MADSGEANAITADIPSYPYAAMLSMCVGVVAQCIAFTAPFTFVSFMVVDFGASKSLDTAGYSAGWIAGVYMIGRITSGVAFGVLSDKWGRKPCLIFSMVNVTLTGILFGFSANYSMAILARLLWGLGNGFMSVCPTVITELVSHKDHESRAFGWVNGAFGLGYIIGPAIGGLLARPALQYPTLVNEDSLWGHFPYLLPCLACSAISALAALLIYLYVPETYQRHTQAADADKSEVEMGTATITQDNKQYGSLNTSDSAEASDAGPSPAESKKASVGEILGEPQLVLIILMNFCFAFFAVMVEEVFPLWCVSSVDRGGLGWSSSQVGLILFCTGVGLVTFQVFLYGPIMAYFSRHSSASIFCYQVVAGAVPLILMIVCEYAAVRALGLDRSGAQHITSALVYALIVALYSVHSFLIGMCYATISILINSSVSPAQRGTMNGMTGTAASLGNFFAPVVGANLFALIDSWHSRRVDGRVVFLLCGALLIALGWVVKVKVDPPAASR